jgi:hypothetical protein
MAKAIMIICGAVEAACILNIIAKTVGCELKSVNSFTQDARSLPLISP